MGTFTVNMVGTIVLAITTSLTRNYVYPEKVVSLLGGIGDGYCGCLSTVSSWVVELTTLPKKNSYIYFLASAFIAQGLSLLIFYSMAA